MVYAIIAGGVFLSDLILKRYMDKKYARKVRHPRLGGRIVLEKYYNEGAALNFMVKKPKLLRIIHTVILVVVGIFSYFLMRLNGHALEKTGVALLLGGGAGYPTKTLTYPYLGESAALDEVISVLSQIRAFQKHRHDRDREIGISPRTMKYAQYRGKLYPYGLCEVSIS